MTASDNITLKPFTGRGQLTDIVAELRRRVDVRNDFVIDTRELSVKVDEDGKVRLMPSVSAMDFLPRDGMVLTDSALMQLAARCNPKMNSRFVRDAIKAAPARWADFTTGVMHDNHARRFVRCLDDTVRAVLSDSYRVIEPLDVVQSVLEGAQGQPVKILEASITDKHLRIKLVNNEVFAKVEEAGPRGAMDHTWIKPGATASNAYMGSAGNALASANMQAGKNTVWPVVTVATSDTGHGSFNANVGIMQALCLNLVVIEKQVAHVHLGKRMEIGFAADTVSAEAKAITLKARDTIRTAFDEGKFNALIDKLDKSRSAAIESPTTAIRNVIGMKTNALADSDLDALVDAIGNESRTVYGVGQAVSRIAQDATVERAEELEKLAGQILVGNHNRAVLAAAN